MSIKHCLYFLFFYCYFCPSEAVNRVNQLNDLIGHPGWIIIPGLFNKTQDVFDYDVSLIFHDEFRQGWTPPSGNEIFATEETYHTKLEEIVHILSGYYAIELSIILELLSMFYKNYIGWANAFDLSRFTAYTRNLNNVLIRMDNVMSYFYSMTNKKLFGLDDGKNGNITYGAIKIFQNLSQSLLNYFHQHDHDSNANVLSNLTTLDEYFNVNLRPMWNGTGFYITSNITNIVRLLDDMDKIDYFLDKFKGVVIDLIDVHAKLGFVFNVNNQIIGILTT